MNPDSNAPAQQSHMQNPLAVMQPGERIICEIKRHPIGMIGTYLGTGIILIVLAIVSLIVVPGLADSSKRGSVMAISAVLFLLVAAVILTFVFIAHIVYWGNKWIVTSDSITQVIQTSLFHKQSSQLSLANLEDVTADKNGILASMFNFGVLKAETAGERSKFMFLFCPDPESEARKILSAREEFEQGHHGGKQPPGQLGATATSYETPTAAQDQQPPAQMPGYTSPQPASLPQPGYGAYQPPNDPQPLPQTPPSNDSNVPGEGPSQQ